MVQKRPMKSSWLAVAVAGAGVLLLVLFLRSGPPPDQPADESVTTSVPKARDASLERRFQEFHGARAAASPGAPGSGTRSQFAVRSSLPVTPERRQNASAAPAMQQPGAPAGGQPGALPSDEDPDDIPSLTRTYQQDPDPERRLAAVTLLGASDDPQVIPILAQALSDKDEEVRLAAVQALSDFTGEAAVDAIEPALNDPSADIRYEALEVLADLDAERARPFVEKALNDPDEEVRTLAESLLALDEGAATAPGGPTQPGGPDAPAGPPS
jgi:hypothetical protein